LESGSQKDKWAPSARIKRSVMKVFVSSTFKNMKIFREATRKAIIGAGHEPILIEELWGTTNPKGGTDLVSHQIQELISDCDVFVLVLGNELGAKVPGLGIPWITLETNIAHSRNIPILAYLVDVSRSISGDDGDILAAGFSSKIVRRVINTSQLTHALRNDIMALSAKQEPKNQAQSISLVSVAPSDFKTLLSNPRALHNISPRFFEDVIAELLRADGWDVNQVIRVNAPGPDIIAVTTKLIKDVPIKMIVECKKWREDRPVDIDVVRKVMYWVNEEFRSTLGMIVTTSRFTTEARIQAESLHQWRLDLKDYDDITNWLGMQLVRSQNDMNS